MGVKRTRNGDAHPIGGGKGCGGACKAYTGPKRECCRCASGMDCSGGDDELSEELVEGEHCCELLCCIRESFPMMLGL